MKRGRESSQLRTSDLRALLRENKEAICASPPGVTITDWDVSGVDDMSGLFDGWDKFNQPLSWNTESVRSMRAAFRGCASFNQSLDWDTSACRDFGFMFEGCASLKGTIALDFSAITSDIDYGLRAMFEGPRRDSAGELKLDGTRESAYSTGRHAPSSSEASLLARNLQRPAVGPRFMPPSVLGALVDVDPYSWVEFDSEGLYRAVRRYRDAICADPPTLVVTNWDVSKVTDMSNLFLNFLSFNQELAWDVSRVEKMDGMFYMCDRFNQSLGGWDVSNVKTMQAMFKSAMAFDQPLSGWKSKVSRVADMSRMFEGCSAFNRPIDWDTHSCKNFGYMFSYCANMASQIRLDMTSAADAESVAGILKRTSGAKLSVTNANALVTAALVPERTALDVQGPHEPAAQRHNTCLLCETRPARPARHAPPCGHVVFCIECALRTSAQNDPMHPKKCPECGIEFDRTFLVNRNLRDDEKHVPENEDTCGVCFSGFPVIAHRACGGSYCASCWSVILNGTRMCPSCKAPVTSSDIFRTYFGLFV